MVWSLQRTTSPMTATLAGPRVAISRLSIRQPGKIQRLARELFGLKRVMYHVSVDAKRLCLPKFQTCLTRGEFCYRQGYGTRTMSAIFCLEESELNRRVVPEHLDPLPPTDRRTAVLPLGNLADHRKHRIRPRPHRCRIHEASRRWQWSSDRHMSVPSVELDAGPKPAER